MRITRSVLQSMLDRLNSRVASSHAKMELDYASCYGGWVLVNYNGARHVTPRMSAKEMRAYLDGALDWVS